MSESWPCLVPPTYTVADSMLSDDQRSLATDAEEVRARASLRSKVEKGQKHPVSNWGRRRTQRVGEIYHGTMLSIQAGTSTEMKVEMATGIELQSPRIIAA